MNKEQKYAIYEKLLVEWNGRINLVAKSTLSDIRGRHIEDSAQLADHISMDKTVIDLGSGAGFPAVVLAILGYNVIAIESIGKKCRFLEELKKRLDLPNLTVINDRIENLTDSRFGIRDNKPLTITSRAFASLTRILDLTSKLDIPYVLLKGRDVKNELAVAREKYDFDAILYKSKTGDGHIIKLTTK